MLADARRVTALRGHGRCRHCGAEHVRDAPMRSGSDPDRSAPCMQNRPNRLHPGHDFVVPVHRTATRNAHGDCGPVVSLKGREGSKPLRQRRFRPRTVCRARAPFGLHSESPRTHPTRLRRTARMRAMACPDGHYRRLEVPGCCGTSECHSHTPETPMFPCSCRCMHAVCIRRMRFAYADVCGLHTGGMVSNFVSSPRRPHRLRVAFRIPVTRVRRPDRDGPAPATRTSAVR